MFGHTGAVLLGVPSEHLHNLNGGRSASFLVTPLDGEGWPYRTTRNDAKYRALLFFSSRILPTLRLTARRRHCPPVIRLYYRRHRNKYELKLTYGLRLRSLFRASTRHQQQQ